MGMDLILNELKIGTCFRIGENSKLESLHQHADCACVGVCGMYKNNIRTRPYPCSFAYMDYMDGFLSYLIMLE